MHPILSKGPFIYYVITFRGRGVWEMLILVLKLSRIKINLAYGKGGGRVQKATKYAYIIQAGPSMLWFFYACCRGSMRRFLKLPAWLG